MKIQNNGYYYDVRKDLEEYPEAWCYVVVGGRNTGKTYSALRYVRENKIPFVYVKRTNKDVATLCAGNTLINKKEDDNQVNIDFSPFKSLNRDFGWNIKAFSIPKVEGIAGFWECDEEGKPYGSPIGYVVSLNAISDVKGFDISECDVIIFDEFIPQKWERVNRKEEGNQTMELYKTVTRDREHRGKKPIKLIALANAVSISNPLMNVLEVTDIFADMQAGENCSYYIPERGILLHQILDNKEFMEAEKKSILYKAMGETNWGRMAFENQFAYDDFSSISKNNLKAYIPRAEIIYKKEHWYLYQKAADFYICKSRALNVKAYDLNKENDQKLFYYDRVIDLRNACMEGRVKFQAYTMYDVIVNYKQFFKV